MEALKPIEVACPLCEAEAGHHCRNILRRGNPEVVWNHYPREDAARDTNHDRAKYNSTTQRGPQG